ncbi:hypothetical protein CDN98_04500 [Roseateles terrae]|nr:hypothetical protein CDN98_04500 [Roseateles terrae]
MAYAGCYFYQCLEVIFITSPPTIPSHVDSFRIASAATHSFGASVARCELHHQGPFMKRHSFPRKFTARAARQQGYTLIELSIALAIISVIIVGSLFGVQRILANNRANNLLAEVPRINAALVGAAVNSATFSDITTKRAAALGAFSPNTVAWNGDNVTVTNSFGGALFIQGNAANFDGVGGPDRGYIVIATGIPTDMCATVVNGLAPLAQAMWVETTAPTAEPGSALTNFTEANLVKGPAANAAVNLIRLADKCRADGEGPTRVINAFIPL